MREMSASRTLFGGQFTVSASLINKIILHDTATQRSSFLGNLPPLFLGLYLTLRVQTSIGSNGGKVLITSKFTWVTSHKICGGMKRQYVF